MPLSKGLVAASGEHFVAAELARRGWVVTVTTRSAEGVDVFASQESDGVTRALQVKTSRGDSKSWMLNSKAETWKGPTRFYVFVNLRGLDPPEFHIVPSAVVARAVRDDHRAWLAGEKRSGGQRKDTSMRKFHDPENRYRGVWSRLGKS